MVIFVLIVGWLDFFAMIVCGEEDCGGE